MQVFLIEDQKQFMTELLTKESFDKLLLAEARIEGRGHMLITGKPAEDFFDEGEMSKADPTGYLPYGMYRDTVFSFIKGNRTPSGLMIQLLLPRGMVERIIGSAESAVPPDDVESLSLLIRFKDKSLTLTTGTTISGFYPDRSVEHGLDKYAEKFLTDCKVSFIKQL